MLSLGGRDTGGRRRVLGRVTMPVSLHQIIPAVVGRCVVVVIIIITSIVVVVVVSVMMIVFLLSGGIVHRRPAVGMGLPPSIIKMAI